MTGAAVRTGLSTYASVRESGYDGVPWPEWLHGSPALVVPQLPDLPRPIEPAAGWTDSPQEASGHVHPDWQMTLTGRQLTITGPGSAVWFAGYPLLARDWIRAAVVRHQVLLVSGAFASIDQFRGAAQARALRLLLVGVR
ncbi:hypothetical protein [Streptacidiphilus sp. MAP5-52]|uniref:hypothetical protein n=1 Tax=Streptacidiphilus sp. MAP5-52 TaxID=3156267 RepID=UPI0035116482